MQFATARTPLLLSLSTVKIISHPLPTISTTHSFQQFICVHLRMYFVAFFCSLLFLNELLKKLKSAIYGILSPIEIFIQ
jgi:hypothetical protein